MWCLLLVLPEDTSGVVQSTGNITYQDDGPNFKVQCCYGRIQRERKPLVSIFENGVGYSTGSLKTLYDIEDKDRRNYS